MASSVQHWLLSRRALLVSALAGTVGVFRAPQLVLAATKADDSAWQLSDAEWKRRLSPEAYRVLRQEGTEPPFTSLLNNEKRSGTFHCAGCDLPLFSSAAKFDSGTGWPSFWQGLPGAIATKIDFKLSLIHI